MNKYFKYATEIGKDMSAEGQMVTKTQFPPVLKRPILFFSGISKVSVEQIYGYNL